MKIYLLILILLIILYLIVFLCKKYYKTVEPFISNNKKLIKTKNEIYKIILKRVMKVCNELDIPCFLSSGTCLGYFRDNDFIEYDYDIDVGIFAKDYNPLIIKKLEEVGFNFYRKLGNIKTGLEISFRLVLPEKYKDYEGFKLLQKWAKLDIFTHHLEKDEDSNLCYFWTSYKWPTFKERIKYRVPYFTLQPIKFKGSDMYVPFPTDSYLRNHYGDDWQTPKRPFKEYYYATSPVSIVKK